MSGDGQAATILGKPTLPCPSWCQTSHEGDKISGNHDHTRSIDGTDTYVGFMMTDYWEPVLARFNGQIHIYIVIGCQTVSWPLDQAKQIAKMAELFGRDDIAGLVRELAGLARTGGEA